MKLAKSVVLSATVLATLAVTNNKVFAANLALSNAKLVAPSADADISGICSDLNQCKPGEVITVLAPKGFSSRTVINDTNFDITKSVYTILPNQDIVWNPASNYSFYGNQEISPDGKTLTFSNGAFAAGTIGLFTRMNDTPVKFTVSIEGKPSPTSIPESSTTLGVIVLGYLGVMLRKRITKAAAAE